MRRCARTTSAGICAAAVGPDKLPEFVHISDTLPRREDGNVRRGILRLISTNQVDLIEPLIASADERRITGPAWWRERKNPLQGAPAIATALAAHPGVRDVAVLAYPDRLTGTGLYAFVEAGGGRTSARTGSQPM